MNDCTSLLVLPNSDLWHLWFARSLMDIEPKQNSLIDEAVDNSKIGKYQSYV